MRGRSAPPVLCPTKHHTGVASALSVFAPRDERERTGVRLTRTALIEDRIRLPGRLLLANPSRVVRMWQRDGLSVRQIAHRLDVSHSAVLEALARLGIRGSGRGRVFQGQVPLGWDLHGSRLVKNGTEQQAIRLMRQLHGGGESLNGIARELDRHLVPTENAGLWQANTVGKMLRRMASRVAS